MIACFGSPMVDLISNVSQEYLDGFGLKNDTAYGLIDPEILETRVETNLKENGAQFFLRVGGSVTNTVRVINWICPTSRICYVGAIGDDSHGEFIKKKLKSEGIHCIFQTVKQTSTAKCVVLINKLERTRTLCTELGASKSLNLNETIINDLKDIKCIYFSGFSLLISIDLVSRLLSFASGKILVYNLGATFIFDKFKREILEIFSVADIIFGNKQEFLSLAHLLNIQAGDFKELLIKVNKNCVAYKNKILVITTEKQVYLARGDKVSVYQVDRVDELVDTNGAGDAFTGGFLAEYLINLGVEENLEKCVACGIFAAKEIVKNIGCDFDGRKTFKDTTE